MAVALADRVLEDRTLEQALVEGIAEVVRVGNLLVTTSLPDHCGGRQVRHEGERILAIAARLRAAVDEIVTECGGVVPEDAAAMLMEQVEHHHHQACALFDVVIDEEVHFDLLVPEVRLAPREGVRRVCGRVLGGSRERRAGAARRRSSEDSGDEDPPAGNPNSVSIAGLEVDGAVVQLCGDPALPPFAALDRFHRFTAGASSHTRNVVFNYVLTDEARRQFWDDVEGKLNRKREASR